MNQSLDILAISGSLRATSSNTAALQVLAVLAPADVTITVYDQLADLPPFNPDLDRETDIPPAPVHDLRARVGRADGIIISSPEYAHGVPGVLKNALDWLVSSLEFPGKPVALLNITPRATYVQAALTETLRTMSASLLCDDVFTVALPRDRLDGTSMLADPQITQAFSAALHTFVQVLQTPGSDPGAG